MAEIVTKRNLSNNLQQCCEPITPERWNILNCLCEKDGCNQKALAESLLKDISNITLTLSVMERRKLIQKIKDPADGRSQKIYLTSKGKEIKSEIIHLAQKAIDKSMEGISQDEENQVILILKKLIGNIQ